LSFFKRSDRHRGRLRDDAGRPADHRQLGLGLENRPVPAVPPIVNERQRQQRLAEAEGRIIDQEFKRINPAFAGPRDIGIEIPLEELAFFAQATAEAQVTARTIGCCRRFP